MPRLRTNHDPSRNSGSSIARVGLFGAIIAGLVFFFQQSQQDPQPDRIDYAGEAYFLPEGGTGQVVHHQGFSLSYDSDWEQAEWTAHILRREQLEQPWTRRTNDRWRPDSQVRGGTASHYDYRGSGYDRGHMVPFADLAWNADWADESFLMSNISPQARQFNQGIWRELEELTRDWAKKFDRLYVISGPVMTLDPKGEIGRETSVAIPAAYFKVLLDLDDPEQKGIGFLLPNQVSFDPLMDFAVSIDQVEETTGLDFFPDLMPKELEEELEADGNIDLWPFDRRKYERRINDWNNVND